jgi:hypothetical protein
MNLAEEVIDLDQVCRQTDDQVVFKGIIERLRLGWMNEQDEAHIRVLTLYDDHYTSKDIKYISEGALHLFARHQAKNAYNEQKLRETVTETNPLAVIQCIDETTATNANSKSTHLNKTFYMRKTILCRDTMVEITKVNIEPKWGLFNGAISTVVDIIFREGENPNEGHLPTVVVMDLKHYRGAIWDKDNPTHVPIVPIQRRCEPMCCTRKQRPLQIAWAKTINSLQGHNAGPTAKHQTPNAIQRIVIHLGERTDETINPGFMYVAVSRATTIGDLGHITSIPQKCMNSVLYFRAAFFPVGIKRLTHSYSTGYEYVRVKHRTAWVAYLDDRQEQTSIMTALSEREMVLEWMENKTYSQEEILAVVRNNKWRKIKQYTIAEILKPPLTRRQKDTIFSPIPRNLTALMAGAQIE